jgi:Thermostable hemolysin
MRDNAYSDDGVSYRPEQHSIHPSALRRAKVRGTSQCASRNANHLPRERIAEVGNVASHTPGDAREVIVRLTDLLHGEGMRWVLFVATQQLRNTFDRLRLATVLLAPADPARLQDASASSQRNH